MFAVIARRIVPLLLLLPVAAGAEDEPFRVARLDNGLTLLMAPSSAHPVIALSGYVTTGGRTEDEYFQGSLHYIEHLVFKGGTPNLEPTQYRKKMSLLGREAGGWTWDDEINFGFEVPRQNFAEALTTFREALLDLQFEEEWFEAEKEVVIQELTRGMEQPGNLIYHKWNELAFQRHPYRRPVIGSEKAVRELDMGITDRYYRDRFTPNHMILSIAGDFDPDEMIAHVQAVWGGETPGPDSFELGLEEPEQTGPRTRVDHLETATDSRVLTGVVTPGGHHEDTPALDMLAELMNDTSYGLPQYLVEQEKWVTWVGAGQYAMRDYGTFTASARVEPAKAAAVTEFLNGFLLDFDPTTVPADIFEATRRSMLFQEAQARDSAADRAERFGFLVSRRGEEGARAYLDRIRAITPEEVRDAKARWIHPRRLVTATVHPDGFDPADAIARAVEPRAPFAPPTPELAVAGALQPAGVEPLAYRALEPVDGVHTYVFDNGLRVVVQPTDASRILAVSGRVLGGQWAEADGQEGLNRFVSELGMRGTRRWNREGFARLLSSRSLRATTDAPSASRANTSRNVDYRDSAGHHYVGLDTQWDAILACLKETVFFPAFDAAEIEKLREDQLTEIRSLPENNLEYIKQEFYRRAYALHPYGRPTIGTDASVRGFTAESAAAFHAAVWTPDRTVVSIVGNVAPDEVAAWIASRWADLPAGPAEPYVQVPAALPAWSPPAEREVLDLGKDYWTVNWGRPGRSYADPEWLDSIVLGRMAGNAHFYKYVYGEGVSYRSWINFWPNLGAGTWILENDVKRERFDEILEMFDEDLARYAGGGFTQEEFDDTIQRLVNRHILTGQDNAAQAWDLAVAVGNGVGTEHHTGRVAALRAVSFDDVLDLSREVFAPSSILRLVQQ